MKKTDVLDWDDMFFKRNIAPPLLLDGSWKYKTDVYGEGKSAGFMKPHFNDSAWRRMRIPTNWHLSGLKDYSGTVWFRKRFREPDVDLGKLTLRFDGVDYYSEVWLNGKRLGSHEGYFAPFEFDITALIEQENLLAVKVDSPEEKPGVWPNRKRLVKGVYNHHDCRPGSVSVEDGQKGNTGGIWNSVKLISTGPIKIDNVLVHQKFNSEGVVTLHPQLYLRNLEKTILKAEVLIEIQEEDGVRSTKARRRVTFSPGSRIVRFSIRLDKPKLWWPWDLGSQNCYSIKIRVSVDGTPSDEVERRFGLRKVSVDQNSYWHINGIRFFPRGTNIIHTQWLAEMNRKKYERDLKMVKECNINFVRVHAHVEREELYDVADEMGILVWQDFPLQWSYDNSDWFVKKTIPMLKDMIHTFFNHPSIAVWCCHNEPHEPNRNKLDRALYKVARKLDASRYIHPASEFKEHVYPGWYYGHYHMYVGIPGCPLPTEFGAQALPNLDSMKKMFKRKDLWPPNWRKWAFHDFQYEETFHVAKVKMGRSIGEFIKNSQEYQAKLLKFAIENYRKRKYTGITGIFQFMFIDPWPAITWSVVDYFRRPKMGYFMLQKIYSPVYMILTPHRDEFSQGSGFFGDFTILNDLHRWFRKAKYRWWVETPSGEIFLERKGTIDIPPDSVKTISPLAPMEVVLFPKDAETGIWKVKGWIKHGKKLIAKNEETFRMLSRPKNVPSFKYLGD